MIYKSQFGFEAPAIIVQVLGFATGECEIHPFAPELSIALRMGEGNVVARYNQRGEAGIWRWPSRL